MQMHVSLAIGSRYSWAATWPRKTVTENSRVWSWLTPKEVCSNCYACVACSSGPGSHWAMFAAKDSDAIVNSMCHWSSSEGWRMSLASPDIVSSAVAGDLVSRSPRMQLGTKAASWRSIFRYRRWFLSGRHRHRGVVSHRVTRGTDQGQEVRAVRVSYGHP